MKKYKKESETRPENTCDHADDDIEDDEKDIHNPRIHHERTDDCNRQSQKRRNQQTAEDIKGADEKATIMIHEIFNMIIKHNSMAPSSWKSYDHSDVQERRRQIQRTAGRSVVFHNFTNSSSQSTVRRA